MPGKIEILIAGDAIKYFQELDKVDQKVKTTRKRTDNLHKDTIVKDDIINARIDDTVQRANQAFDALARKSKVEVEAAIRIQTERYNMVMKQLAIMAEFNLKQQELKWTQEADLKINDVGRRMKEEVDKHNAMMAQLENELERFKLKARLTVNTALIGLRAVTDIAALVSIATGERIDVQYLSMISMGISAVMQVKMQAAIYGTTPGMQPFALMMLAMIPTLTGMISFFKSEQAKLARQFNDQRTQDTDALLDSVKY